MPGMSSNGRPIPLRLDAGELVRRDFQTFHRTLAGHVLGRVHDQSPDKVVRGAWPDDHRAAVLTRAASSPLDTTSGAALTATKTSPLLLVAPPSAAARLFENCVQLDFAGVYAFYVPHVNTHPAPLFVSEGSPIPFVQPSTGKATVGPVRKLAFGLAVTDELNDATPETATIVLGRLLGESAAKALDTYVFDSVAGDATRPPGLLNGVTPLTATTGSGGIDAAAADLAALAGAIADAGMGADNLTLVCNPREATKLRLLRGPVFEFQLLSTPAIAAGTVIAIVPTAIASGTEGLPDVPTVGDFVPGYEASTWYGVGAPRSTSAEIVEKLNRQINAAVADPIIKARLVEQGGTVFSGSPTDFEKLIADDTAKWAKVIRGANIKPE